MQTSILTLQNQLEAAREQLKGVEESIKKTTGRDINVPIDRPGFKRNARHLEFNDLNEGLSFKKRQFEGAKGRLGDRVVTADNEKDWNNTRNVFRGRAVSRPAYPRNQFLRENQKFRNSDNSEESPRVPAKKRLGDVQPNNASQNAAVTVFSRLSGPPKEDEEEKQKITSQVLVTETPSREEILAAQSKDTSCKARNKRMFGALLGTLQQFRQEESRLREKEEKKAKVERKVEEAEERDKQEAKKARQELFSSRRRHQLNIRHIEFKLVKLKQFSEWESRKSRLLPFVQTETVPKVFFLPKMHNEKTKVMLEKHQQAINKTIEKKRKEIEKQIEDHEPAGFIEPNIQDTIRNEELDNNNSYENNNKRGTTAEDDEEEDDDDDEELHENDSSEESDDKSNEDYSSSDSDHSNRNITIKREKVTPTREILSPSVLPIVKRESSQSNNETEIISSPLIKTEKPA